MAQQIIFLTYVLLPFVLGLLLSRKTRYLKRLAIGMAYNQRVRLGMVTLLAIYTLHLHVFYSLARPVSYGFYLSFFYMLTFISMKRHERLLLYLRADRKRLISLGFASIIVAAIPGMLTVGMTMAYTLIFACLFPRKTKQLSPKTEEPKAESATSDAASQTNSDSHEEE